MTLHKFDQDVQDLDVKLLHSIGKSTGRGANVYGA